MGPLPESPVAKLVQERAALEGEHDSLVSRLADAEAELETSRTEAAALRRLQLELQSRQPEVTRAVEAAVMREQALQEERNRKVCCLILIIFSENVASGGGVHFGDGIPD
jgi:hypothetical protein